MTPQTTTSASTAEQAHDRLAWLASRQTHSLAGDNHLPTVEIEQKILSGRRIRVGCGMIASIGVRQLRAMGVPARLVATVTYDELSGVKDEGHTLLEARLDGHWQVFDLDMNRKPVDRYGRGVTITRLCGMGDRKFIRLASDRAVDYHGWGQASRDYFREMWRGGVDRWYDRVLGVPAIYNESGPLVGWLYTGDALARDAVARSGFGWAWVPPGEFAALEA